MKWIIAGATCVVLPLGGCGGDDEGYGCSSADPFSNVVSDKRAPKTTVAVRDNGEQPVADIAYSTPNHRVPDRGTTVSLQAFEAGTWSTAYTLALDTPNIDDDRIIGCVPEVVNADSVGGSGPDTDPLPDLDPAATYRICVTFVFRHRPTEATGCSAPFHSN